MRVPYSWIKEFIDIDKSAEEVVEKLNVTGIEAVCYPFGERIENITTVKITSLKKHPEKDRLLICEATDGSQKYQVVTGADNVFEGAVVILAKEGAIIKGIPIKNRKFGSILSEGMFLSVEELGIAEKSDGVLILPKDTSLGADPNEILGLGSEKIIEIEITPNRGDALSVRGLAREIGAIFRIKRKEKLPIISIAEESNPNIQLQTEKCLRYRGIVIRDVEVKSSPLDIQLKLLKSGLNPINNVVDITNLILLQEGQPLHAFDLDKIEGSVTVRAAYKGEKILTLDGEEKTLTQEDIVIADSKKPIAVAGVIGGENTKVDWNTRNILLEAAVFDHISVRKTSKRLSISTDSSYRFERGVDIENLPNAQDKAVEYIISTAGGSAVGIKDLYPQKYQPKKIFLREKTVERVLGSRISKEECSDILNALEIPSKVTDDGVSSEIPSFRSFDLKREIDLVEEVGRLKGFDRFTETFPMISVQNFKKSNEFLFELRTRDFFKDNGLNEVVTYTFVSEEIYKNMNLTPPEIRISNYLLKTQSVMRDNLAVSLIGVLQENLRHQLKDISIFEISSAFFDEFEEIRVGILLTGKYIKGFKFTKGDITFSTTAQWDFLKVKGLINSYLISMGIQNYVLSKGNIPYLNPYESALIEVEGKNIGYFGIIHPEVAERLEIPKDTYIAELKLRYVPRSIDESNIKDGYIYTLFQRGKIPTFKELPKFPSVKRDLSFEVAETLEIDKLINVLKESSNLIDKVELFDIYYISDKVKSVALSVEFRAEDRSLSDEEVNMEVAEILDKIKKVIPEIKLRQ
ncbi:phenylalanine--tRNA ligase subunit beta [Persephonella sp.]